MIDATHLKAHRTAASLLEEGIDIYADPRCFARTKAGLNSKLHVVSDGKGRPSTMLLSGGQMSDNKGAVLMLNTLPPARVLIGDKGYSSDRFRQALTAWGTEPCVPSHLGRRPCRSSG
jgi:hypothetical protein